MWLEQKRVFGPQIFTLDFPTKHLTLHKTASSTRVEHKLKELSVLSYDAKVIYLKLFTETFVFDTVLFPFHLRKENGVFLVRCFIKLTSSVSIYTKSSNMLQSLYSDSKSRTFSKL